MGLEGKRVAAFNNGENIAGEEQSFIVLGSDGFGSFIFADEASSDGCTIARKYDAGVDGDKIRWVK